MSRYTRLTDYAPCYHGIPATGFPRVSHWIDLSKLAFRFLPEKRSHRYTTFASRSAERYSTVSLHLADFSEQKYEVEIDKTTNDAENNAAGVKR